MIERTLELRSAWMLARRRSDYAAAAAVLQRWTERKVGRMEAQHAGACMKQICRPEA